MRIKTITYFVLLSAIILVINSCSETTSTNDAPVIISLSKTTATVGETITISGMRFGTVRGSGYVSFNLTQALDYISWSDTSVVVKIPAGATSGNVVVYANNKQSNGAALTILQNYFPNAVGNYWVYESFELDTAGSRNESTRKIDSVVITGTASMFGKLSTKYTTFTEGGQFTDDYYYTENGKFYATISNVMPEQMPIPIDYTDAWIVIADPDSSSWTIFSQELKDVEMQLPTGGTGILNGTFTIKGEKGLNKTIQTGEGQTINVIAQEYKILYSYNGKITIQGLPLPLDLNFTVTSHKWYGENIGLVLDRTDPASVQVSVVYRYNIPGRESSMLRYHVSQ